MLVRREGGRLPLAWGAAGTGRPPPSRYPKLLQGVGPLRLDGGASPEEGPAGSKARGGP